MVLTPRQRENGVPERRLSYLVFHGRPHRDIVAARHPAKLAVTNSACDACTWVAGTIYFQVPGYLVLWNIVSVLWHR